MMKKVKALWELMRLEHGFMLCIAILVGSLIAFEAIPPYQKFLFTFLTALFLEASTFALNDYFDLEIDKKNKRDDRPLVRGDLLPRTALIVFAILFPLGVLCSLFVNLTCFVIAVVTGVIAILYDARLKRIKLVGNFYIAYTMAIPFVFGGAAVINSSGFSIDIPPVIFVLALIAFLAGVGREIMKDVMDFEGDKKTGVRSFPKYLGVRGSNALASTFYLFAIVLSFFPFFMSVFESFYLDIYYILFIVITDSLLLMTSFQLLVKKKPNLKFHRKATLFALFIGLVGFLVGAFVV